MNIIFRTKVIFSDIKSISSDVTPLINKALAELVDAANVNGCKILSIDLVPAPRSGDFTEMELQLTGEQRNYK